MLLPHPTAMALHSAPTAVQLLAVGYRVPERLRLRTAHIPLVRPLPWLLGHMWTFRKTPMYLCYQRWQHEYGPIFLCFFGKNPVVVLSGARARLARTGWVAEERGGELGGPCIGTVPLNLNLCCCCRCCSRAADPDLVRQVAVKQFVRFHDRPALVAVPNR